MDKQRYLEITDIFESWNWHQTRKIPYGVFATISDDGIVMMPDEDWQGKATRFLQETKISAQEIRDWALLRYQEETET